MCLSNSRRVCTTSSAAAEGVEARTSETKSAMVKSVSWPMPEITGMCESKMARATISSLKTHKSSSEPPPRTSINTSPNFLALKNFSALTICWAAPSPCTRTRKTVRWTLGTRRVTMRTTSRTAAPRGEVLRPVRLRRRGRGFAAVGDFALDENVGEISREQVADAGGELADGEDLASGLEVEGELAHWASTCD